MNINVDAIYVLTELRGNRRIEYVTAECVHVTSPKTEESLNVLSSSGIRGTEFISVYNSISSSKASFIWKPVHIRFRSYGSA